ncbi:MAG: hypothetical protein WBM17_01115 [Anaerolineales bacterium]
MTRITFRNIVLIWLAWVLIVIGFQGLATARFQPQWPDRSQTWTETYTMPDVYQVGRPYLLEPFMNNQVAWDSEYYIGIAVGGYDDPKIPHLTPFGTTTFDYHVLVQGNEYFGESTSLAYAFFPMYPWLMWLFSIPLSILGLNAVATATLAGVVVSALGALGAMLALYDMTQDTLGDDGAMRALFYLIIFPTGFFLVQVYTEGLFVGLAFGCLAMLRRRGWYLVPAAILGAAATLTRAVGVALIIPMAITWFRTGDWLDLDLEWKQIFYFFKSPNRKVLISFGKMILAFAPLIAFLIWKLSWLGINFDFVEARYFGRGFLDFGTAFYLWSDAFKNLSAGIPARAAYFLTEIIGLIVGTVACIACLKRKPEIAWFSLAVLLISWGSGPAQGIQRYILGAPAVFYMLAYWGRNRVFDRVWTIFSTLLMGLLAMLYAFNMWVA